MLLLLSVRRSRWLLAPWGAYPNLLYPAETGPEELAFPRNGAPDQRHGITFNFQVHPAEEEDRYQC